MKTKNFFFFSLTSLLTIQSISPDLLVNIKRSHGRMPAADETMTFKPEVIKSEVTVPEVSKPKISKAEIKKEEEIVLCKPESKGAKLEADLRKLLDDKEDVLKRVENLSKENDELKLKLSASTTEVKKKNKKYLKTETDSDDQSENPQLVTMMGQLTSMFSAQMQAQTQMMNMFTQMQTQTNTMAQFDPYAPSIYTNNIGNYPKRYLPIDSGMNFLESRLGIPAQSSPWSDYNNPYSIMPNMTRQQLPSSSDYGFYFNQTPTVIRGFDFNQASIPQPLMRTSMIN
jgi:hypothetical protein